jgi:hypothetical protein
VATPEPGRSVQIKKRVNRNLAVHPLLLTPQPKSNFTQAAFLTSNDRWLNRRMFPIPRIRPVRRMGSTLQWEIQSVTWIFIGIVQGRIFFSISNASQITLKIP